MPFDVSSLVNPNHTALLTNEVQSSVVHAEGDLAENARRILPNSVMDLANRGYDVVVPSDAVAGTPTEYQDQVMRYTIRYLARVTPTRSILEAWSSPKAVIE